MKRIYRRVWLILLLGLMLACQIASPTPTGKPTATLPPTPDAAAPFIEPNARYQRIFQRVWSLVDEIYVYEDYNGVDWDAVWTEYNSRVAVISDNADFWALMQEMIAQLDDQHSAYLTPEQAAEEDQSFSGQHDYVGIGVYLTTDDSEEYAIVLLTFPESPAEQAGIQPHDKILAVAGEWLRESSDTGATLDLMLGPEGTPVTITVQTLDAPPRTVTVTRGRIQSALPVVTRRIETPEGEIGYLLIPSLWDETIGHRTREALNDLLTDGPLQGLILDMRINGGGAYSQLYNLLSLFTEGEVGQFQQRHSSQSLVVVANPIKDTQTLPLVILIGPSTESYAEVFSGALQGMGRAVLIGAPTAGNIETVYQYNMEDGSRLWLAQEYFVTTSGYHWEGEGLTPDLYFPQTWEEVSLEDDPLIDAAVALLRQN